MNHRSSYSSENGSVNRREFLVALGSAAACIAGCKDEVRNQTKKTIKVADSETPKSDEFQKWKDITETLEKRGAYVKWNHPESGPAKPKFIVSNSHIPHGAEMADSEQALAMASEYWELQFLASQGLKTFAMEGRSWDQPVLPDHVIYIPGPHGQCQISIMGSKLDWRKEITDPRAYRMTPQQIRRHFDDDEALCLFLATQKGNAYRSAGDIFVAAYTNAPNITCIGAEPSLGKEVLNSLVRREMPYLKTFERYNRALKLPEVINEHGNVVFKYTYDDETGEVTRIDFNAAGKQLKDATEAQFTPKELEECILWSLGQLPSQKEHDTHREQWMANELDADVVHIGSGHLRNFLAMTDNKRSLGIVVPSGVRDFSPEIFEDPIQGTRQGQLLLHLKKIRAEAIERVKGAKK